MELQVQAAVADIAHFLSLFEQRARKQDKHLSHSEIHAVTGYLCARVKAFISFEKNEDVLRKLIARSHIFYEGEGTRGVSLASVDSQDILFRVNDPQVCPFASGFSFNCFEFARLNLLD
jgi:hypothetical protein